MESEGVSLPLFHWHLLMPWNDMRRGECCGGFESMSDGFYCKICDLFFHKKCCESPESIQHPSHSDHPLKLIQYKGNLCNLCGNYKKGIGYRCEICDFDVDLYCAKHLPPDVIDISETHNHKLTLLKERVDFDCSANCDKDAFGFPYVCDECDIAFHVKCAWHPPEIKHAAEVNHSYLSLHPLKLYRGKPPNYSDGKCRLCGKKDEVFYHCSSFNFTLDMGCVLHPPPQSVLNLKAHDHQLTLLPRLDSFTCNACGLKGDRSPYICVECNFMIHRDCLDLPRVININRHDHRVSRISHLGVMNSVCGVCRKKVDWTFGGYTCKRCPSYVVHSKCAIREDVWNGEELEGVPEEIEDIEPYVVIDENTIQHFSHKEHYLRFHNNGILYEENKHCNACTHHVGIQSFYGCMDCDFILHQNCAECPKKKRHVLHYEQLALVTRDAADFSCCFGCSKHFNGFMYKHEGIKLDVICGSVSEPFFHPSHIHHPLYYIPVEKRERYKICNGCNFGRRLEVLRCIEDGCEYNLGFECATLPQVIKHRVDDHPLSLCYGEKASGKYWCDICEKETNPEKWFYTCKDQRASLHIECVLGNFTGLMPGSTIERRGNSYEVVLNKSVSRPFCRLCKLRCTSPIILKNLGTLDEHFCSWKCFYRRDIPPAKLTLKM